MTDEPKPPTLAPVREGQGDAEPRKAHYGESGAQPWDLILAAGWGPAFAAGNVLKYLRRSKNPEHSAESAAWYYDRLVDGAAGHIPNWSNFEARMLWQRALDDLESRLSTEELLRVRRLA